MEGLYANAHIRVFTKDEDLVRLFISFVEKEFEKIKEDPKWLLNAFTKAFKDVNGSFFAFVKRKKTSIYTIIVLELYKSFVVPRKYTLREIMGDLFFAGKTISSFVEVGSDTSKALGLFVKSKLPSEYRSKRKSNGFWVLEYSEDEVPLVKKAVKEYCINNFFS